MPRGVLGVSFCVSVHLDAVSVGSGCTDVVGDTSRGPHLRGERGTRRDIVRGREVYPNVSRNVTVYVNIISGNSLFPDILREKSKSIDRFYNLKPRPRARLLHRRATSNFRSRALTTGRTANSISESCGVPKAVRPYSELVPSFSGPQKRLTVNVYFLCRRLFIYLLFICSFNILDQQIKFLLTLTGFLLLTMYNIFLTIY